MSQITVPYNFDPREYQLPVLRELDNGVKRVVMTWHRRGGKDKVCWNYIIKEACRVPAQYYYFAPSYEQGRKIIWDNIDNNGFKMIHHVPKELLKRIDNTRMQIELQSDGGTSLIQVIGTDKVDSVVGTNPRIAVFTEYSLQNPQAWDLIAPIMLGNGGTAIFNFTPRGENHAYDLLEYAKSRPHEWYVSVLGVDDTKVMDANALESEKARLFSKYKDNALFLQEYYCSFDAPIQGSYYGTWLEEAMRENRITNVPYETSIPVDTYWDLGIGDSTAIWFAQNVGLEVRFIDYYETTGESLHHYAKVLQDKGYKYGRHVAPHDIRVRELGTGKSRLEVARSLGVDFDIAPQLSLEEGIDAVRHLFPRCWFDREKTKKGVNALKSYHKEYDETNQVYRDRPKHDWASHGSDSFRMWGVSHQTRTIQEALPDDVEVVSGFY